MDKFLLSVPEAQQVLGLGRNTVLGLLYSGQIASIKVGKRRLVPREAIKQWIERQISEQATEVARD